MKANKALDATLVSIISSKGTMNHVFSYVGGYFMVTPSLEAEPGGKSFKENWGNFIYLMEIFVFQ
jgi:hypothetical protein